MLGQSFALLSAAGFSASGVVIRRAVFRAVEPDTALFVSIFIGTVIFSLALGVSGDVGQLTSASGRALAYLAVAGVINLVVGRGLLFRGLRLIGANLASPLLNSSIVVAVIMGVTLMGDAVTPGSVLGVLFILAGIVAISTEGGGAEKLDGVISKGNMVKGVASALGAGICYGVTPVLVRVAIQEGNSPVTATFVGYAAAMLLLVGIVLRSRERLQWAGFDGPTTAAVLLGGVLGAVAQLFRNWALDYSTVSVVQPLVSSSTLITLFLSFAINRRIELFTWKVIAGALLVVGGVFLIFRV